MEVKKNVTLNTGVMATYWKPVSFNVNIESKSVNLTLAGYKDQAGYEAGFSALATRTANVSLVDIKEKIGDLEKIAQFIYDKFPAYFFPKE